ncbi:esterase/lipase family protein [Nocardioides sp. T2.26MG-1]|uniref:esterase/lipase family protein n=1 Tax=Nocardioides sp. T2.26MG-1 TaxID=3041166 RepID=UPI0025424CFA|nr:alpha/beta fold hydrolase [Nocardioides sp. T2.26MG-1]
MTSSTLADFLLPTGFACPRPAAVLREGSAVLEAGRYAWRVAGEHRARRSTPYAARPADRHGDPVILVPGFLAGDGTLALMARALRAQGFRTYRSQIHANIGCTLNAAAQLETRLESIALRRGTRVQIVGHSLGGMLARGIAVRRPDLVSNIVTMGSPMLAPGAHHPSLAASVDLLVRLSKAGIPGLMSEECVAGSCARQSFGESRQPLPAGVDFTAVYSKRDGIVDWRACVDPLARAVEVTASHLGMAFDPRVIDVVGDALLRTSDVSAVEVDRGKSA